MGLGPDVWREQKLRDQVRFQHRTFYPKLYVAHRIIRDMNYGDVVSAVIAVVAVIISFVSLKRTRVFNERQIKFQEEADRLNRLQRQILEREEAQNNKSDISAYIYHAASGYRLGIVNTGNVSVANVNLQIESRDDHSSPLIPQECEDKLPIPHMAPKDETNLIMDLTFDTGTTFTARFEWETEDGEKHRKESHLSI